MAFMTIGAVTTGVQSVTATGAVTPTNGLDISGITKDWTAFLQVQSLTSGKKAKIQLEYSTNAFTNSIALEVFDVEGSIASTADKVYNKRSYEAPSALFGVSSAVLRANVVSIDGSATLAINSWVEY